MRSLKSPKPGTAKEIAGWTGASLLSVGNSLRSAGSSLVTGLKTGYEQLTLDHSDKEKVTFVKFGRLEFHLPKGAESSCAILLLGYDSGFQLWSLRDSVKEIASRRDGPVRCLEPIPLPKERDQARCSFLAAWPLVAVVSDEPQQSAAKDAEDYLPVSYVKLYSLQSHSYTHSIAVPGRVLSISCSRRVLLVAMSTQIMAYDLATMQMSYSAITYPAPNLKQPGDKGPSTSAAPLALGPRWLAHASNQAVQSASGVAVAQPIANPGSRGSPMGNNIETVQHYASLAAKTSGKHIKTLGEASYKYLSSQVESWRNSNGASVPSSPSSTATLQPDQGDVVGTVIVRDMVSRSTLVHFRAHTSPLLLLRFDGSGTLLVTASVHGHTVNIFHVAPGSPQGSAAHLFRLSRGVTPAVIQDVGFSCSGQWLCVSSARGTTHVFRLSAPEKSESMPPHLAAAAIPAADRRLLSPVKLVAAGRARVGSFLNGGIPGSAAASAAVNLYSGTSGSGLVASTFMPRVADASSPGDLLQAAPLDEDLFVAFNQGLLVRHRLLLAPQPPQQRGYSPQDPAPESPASREEGGTELAVEAVEQWDVCRRRSWPEREELVFDASESSGEEGEVSQRQPWSAYAETCLPSSSALPLWADSQFHVLEMQTGSRQQGSVGTRGGDEPSAASSTILEVEEVPTKRVNLQGRGGLAPVIIEGAETAVLRGAHLRSSQPSIAGP